MAFASLEQAFAYYTECALATAESLDRQKSASKSGRARAWSIANGMVEQYQAAHSRMSKNDQYNAIYRLPRLTKRIEHPEAGADG